MTPAMRSGRDRPRANWRPWPTLCGTRATPARFHMPCLVSWPALLPDRRWRHAHRWRARPFHAWLRSGPCRSAPPPCSNRVRCRWSPRCRNDRGRRWCRPAGAGALPDGRPRPCEVKSVVETLISPCGSASGSAASAGVDTATKPDAITARAPVRTMVEMVVIGRLLNVVFRPCCLTHTGLRRRFGVCA